MEKKQWRRSQETRLLRIHENRILWWKRFNRPPRIYINNYARTDKLFDQAEQRSDTAPSLLTQVEKIDIIRSTKIVFPCSSHRHRLRSSIRNEIPVSSALDEIFLLTFRKRRFQIGNRNRGKRSGFSTRSIRVPSRTR